VATDETSVNPKRFARRSFFPGGRMPPSSAGKDACRHIFRQALNNYGRDGALRRPLASAFPAAAGQPASALLLRAIPTTLAVRQGGCRQRPLRHGVKINQRSAGFSPLQCVNWRGRWKIAARAVGRAVKRRERRAPVFGATPETATGTGALPSNVPAVRPMAVCGGRTGQRVAKAVWSLEEIATLLK
jgi:hypothetical protein